MSSYIWHPATAEAMTRYLERPAHALLITGMAGAGKYTLATVLAARLLGLPEDADLTQSPAVKQPLPQDVPTIPIEFIRELREFTKLRSTSRAAISRVILLPDAERMQTAAQNALLKLLEEPPTGTVLILTAQSGRSLLPTITSRTQTLHLHNPPFEAVLTRFKDVDQTAVQRTYLLSNGRVGLLSALLKDNAEHPLAQNVMIAKELIQAPVFERLIKVEEFSKDKNRCLALLEAMEQVLRAALYQSARHNRAAALAKLQGSLERLVEAKTQLHMSVQAKLVLTDLFLNL